MSCAPVEDNDDDCTLVRAELINVIGKMIGDNNDEKET